jgi:DNA-binding NarL/FixJ family response regulator
MRNLPTAAGLACRYHTMPTHILIADDHSIFASLLRDVLNEIEDFRVVDIASDGEQALAMMKVSKVDVVLLDLVMPRLGGLQVLRELRSTKSPVKVIVLTGVGSSDAMAEAFTLGARTFVEKSTDLEELVRIIRAVSSGDVPLTSAASEVMRALVRRKFAIKGISDSDKLVLRHLAAGRVAKEIAADLNLCLSAVYKAQSRLVARLGVKTREGFARAAGDLGLDMGSDASRSSGETGAKP